MLKQVRIQEDGTVVDADRVIKVTKQAAKGGPDKVQWMRVPGVTATFTVHFARSPFRKGPEDFSVPGPPSDEVSQAVGRYKYDVISDATGEVTHDPDVDIES